MAKKSKYDRILSLYSMLTAGDVINKAEAACEFEVNERTIQRDIDDIRAFFVENTLDIGHGKTVVYDRTRGGYRMEDADNTIFTNSEILAVCKILLESRSLVRDEMLPIIDKLLQRCVPEKNKRAVLALINNEKFHYIEPHHGRPFVNTLWDLGQAVREQRMIEIEYVGRILDKRPKVQRIQPVGIMVSEFYFYLAAYNDSFDLTHGFKKHRKYYPTIYRVDRIAKYTVTDQRFNIPYADKFDEGEFRKRVQFMFGGELQKVRFWYTGYSLEAVLDRLPTAEIVEEKEGAWLIEAEVFGRGIEMWLRSQGEYVKVVE